MNEQQQDNGTTGPADEQGAIASDPTRDPSTDPTAAPGPDDAAQQPGASDVNGEAAEVALPYPEPHDVQPGYGVTGKFPTQDPDASDAGDSGAGLVVSAPASATDALEVGAPAPVTVEQPAAEADQLDVPADQRGDTA